MFVAPMAAFSWIMRFYSGLICLICFIFAPSSAGQKPNIILCMTDDQGWGDIGYRSSFLKTPHLDEMARQGARLDRFYAQPTCSPARGSVMTGKDPNRFLGFHPGFDLPLSEKTIAEFLSDEGYATGLFGKWHLGGIQMNLDYTGAGVPEEFDRLPRHPGNQGFQKWKAAGNHFNMDPVRVYEDGLRSGRIAGESSQLTMDWSLDFIREQVEAGKPFLCVIWFSSPHAPWETSEKDSAPYQNKGRWAGHYGEIVALDREMGRLRKELRELDIAQDTMLWFSSDNGGVTPHQNGGLRGAKGNLLEGGIRVPAMVEWPGKIEPSIVKAVGSTNDIAPTVLSAVGVEVTSGDFDGVDLMPVLEGKSSTRSQPLLMRTSSRPDGAVISEAIISEQWKLIRGTIEWKRKDPDVLASPQLYDLQADPSEENDLASSHPEKVAELQKLVDVYRESVEEDIDRWPAGVKTRREGGGRYELYQPKIERHTIYQSSVPKEFGKKARIKAPSSETAPLPYNHTASLAFFDGKFHCIWQGTQIDLRENQKGQRLWLSTSKDFENWSFPEPFVAQGPTAVDGPGVQKQPGMLKYSESELWVVWHHHGGDDRGLYFSRKKKGSEVWENRKLWVETEIGGRTLVTYPTQDGWKFTNGRVVFPCVFISKDSGKAVRFGGAVYTDNGGETWKVSNLFRNPDTSVETWEPFIYEQQDGDVRVFARSPFFETTTGKGARDGEDLRFNGFTQRSWMEGVSERPWVGRIPGQRFVMLKHDAYGANANFGGLRHNLALAFSRSGKDDFLFGPAISEADTGRWNYWSAAYAQGCIVDDALYVAYSNTTPRGHHNTPRSIIGVKVSSLPLADQNYLFPRARQMYSLRRYRDGKGVLRPYSEDIWHELPRAELPTFQQDGSRQYVHFGNGSSAGIEFPKDALRDQILDIDVTVRLDEIQQHAINRYPDRPAGNLTILTIGDKNPIRVAYKPNAGDRLWLFDGWRWQRMDGFVPDQWNRLRIRVSPDGTALRINEGRESSFRGAVLPRNPVTYFGEGVIEEPFDGRPPNVPINNLGSKWRIELDTLKIK